MKVLSSNTIVRIISLCPIVILNPVAYAELATNGEYKIDPTHTTIQFSTTHLGISELTGRFNKFSGNLSLNRSGNSSITVDIVTASIDTNNAARDKHLRSPDFFNVKQYPTMKFVSNKISFNNKGEPNKINGILSLHGKKRSIEWTITKIGAGKDPWGGYRAGYNANTTIKRSDFGMKFMPGGVGDKINLKLNIELLKK